jgi:hypothetical protein
MVVEQIARLTGHNASIFSISPGPGDQQFLSGAGDGWIVEWDLENPELGRLIAKVETQIFSLTYLPQYHWVVAGNMYGGVHWVDLNNPDSTKNIAHHQKGVFGVIAVKDVVFTIGGGGVLTKWSIADRRTMESIQLCHESLRAIDFCPERNELAIGASDHSIYFLDASSMRLKKRLPAAHENSVFSVRYSQDGGYLYTGSRDAHLSVWDLDNDFERVFRAPAHWYTINEIAMHPDGKWIATGSRDKTIKIWDASSFKLLKVLETIRDKSHLNSVNTLFWHPHRDILISGSDDRTLILWEIN